MSTMKEAYESLKSPNTNDPIYAYPFGPWEKLDHERIGGRTRSDEGWIFSDMWVCWIVYDNGEIQNCSY